MRMKKESNGGFCPRLNVGCIWDIMTGRYVEGIRGEYILTGGLAPFTGVGGPPNHFKTGVLHYMGLTAVDRYRKPVPHLPENEEDYVGAKLGVYDTENTFQLDRLQDLSRQMPWLKNQTIEELEKLGVISLYDRTGYHGEDWYSDLREIMAEKAKNKKNYVTTPFKDRDGKPRKMPSPDVVGIDSLTEFTIENLENLFDSKEIGHKDLNMEAMAEMKAKSHMVRQLPSKTASSATYVIASAHVGEKHQLDPYAITPKKLLFLKGNAQFKRVPQQFNFLPNDVYYNYTMSVLKNPSGDKGPKFPSKNGGDYKDSPELQEVKLFNTRGKAGPTGISYSLAFSQNEGLLPGISEYLFVEKFNKYGFGGNAQNYFLELYPEVSLSRTTFRDKLDSDPKLRRAMHITYELCYMHQNGFVVDPDWLCSPKELYEDLKKAGYDWDELLLSREYWLPLEWEDGAPGFLSTADLLRMRKGLYTPYWMKKK